MTNMTFDSINSGKLRTQAVMTTISKKYKGRFASTKVVHWTKRRKRKPNTKTTEDLVTCDKESSVEIWNLEKDLCRCCHTEGSFGDLAKPNLYLEKVEIYSDMLRESFDIEVDLVPGELCVRTYKICEACILMLRNALTFKKQVQDCEKKFMEFYHKNAIKEISVEIWNLEKDLCRCCHTEGSFGDLAKPNLYLEKVEIYSDMLRDCFDIEVDLVPGELCVRTYKICEACILMLRNALTFKKQVQDCEKKFMELYHKNAIKVLNNKQSTKSVVEEELPERILIDLKEGDKSQMNHRNEDDEDDDDDFYWKEDEVVINNQNSAEDMLVINKKKLKTKDKLNIEKPEMKRRSQRKINEEKRKEAAKEKKDLKEGDKSQMNHRNEDEDDDDDFYWKEDEVIINEKPEMKRDSPRTINKEKGEEAAKEKKGRVRTRLIELQDFRRDGDKYACCRCKMRYNRKRAVACHIRTKHFKIPYVTCQYCPKGFMTRGALTTHKLKDHDIDERHYCKACEAKFSTKVTLGKHMKAFHMLGKKHKCELCDFESFDVEIMSRHKVKHKTSRDYHCRFCKKSFLRKKTLHYHERIHTGDKRKVCKVCSQAFVQKASLNYHMTKYHPNVNF